VRKSFVWRYLHKSTTYRRFLGEELPSTKPAFTDDTVAKLVESQTLGPKTIS